MTGDSPPHDTLVLEQPPGSASASALRQRLGRFTLIDKLGEGGMGEVYAAHDAQLGRKVALKVLTRTLGLSTHARARLIREAQALAQLSHPNVVTVFDAGAHEDEVFIAMELVEGQTLRQWLRAQTRSWAQILEIFVAAGEGLAAIHEHGLVHRDFKPDNALVDARGRVRLIDFGLARHLEPTDDPEPSSDAPAPASRSEAAALAQTESVHCAVTGAPPDGDEDVTLPEALTRTGALVGTVLYMSPEQFRHEAATAPSDQFSFCVALFESLYGYSPFTGDTAKARAFEVMFGEVAPVPRDTDVPPELGAVLARGLRRDPQERWPGMRELLTALHELLRSHDPELDDPQVLRARNRLLATSIGIVTATITVFALLAAAGVIAYTLGSQVIMDAAVLSVFGVAALSTRSQWRAHRRSRNLVGLLSFAFSLYLVQDATGWLTGRSLYHCSLGNLVSVSVAAVFAAPLLVSTVRFCGLWMAGCSLLMLLDPPRFSLYFALGNLGAAVIGALTLPRRARVRWVADAASEGSTTTGAAASSVRFTSR